MTIADGIARGEKIILVMPTLRDITLEEWDDYEWQDVSTFGDETPVFIRGRKKVEEPSDGFVYIEVSRPGEAEQRWVRAQTYLPKED